jgi:hypothetical protein
LIISLGDSAATVIGAAGFGAAAGRLSATVIGNAGRLRGSGTGV